MDDGTYLRQFQARPDARCDSLLLYGQPNDLLVCGPEWKLVESSVARVGPGGQTIGVAYRMPRGSHSTCTRHARDLAGHGWTDPGVLLMAQVRQPMWVSSLTIVAQVLEAVPLSPDLGGLVVNGSRASVLAPVHPISYHFTRVD
jgi:hypothetical protein